MPLKNYQINLIGSIRKQEQVSQRRRTYMLGVSVFCFGLLFLSLFYATLQVLNMRGVIKTEISQLNRIKGEYRKYKEMRMIVNKSDIELLDSLQNNRIFWTKKLAAMALHLPDGYWIIKFGYKPPEYTAAGYGYISPKQEQLITIDDFLNLLRNDSTYNDIFKNTYFNSTMRSDEDGRNRVSFDYSSLRQGR
jgi:hypothetical protein